MSEKSISVIVKSLEYIEDSIKMITLPKDLYSSLECLIDKFKVGMTEEEVSCLPNSTDNIIGMSNGLIKTLGLANNMSVNLSIQNNKVCLGPVIGIFVSNGAIRKANIQNPSFRLVELFRANEDSKTIPYFFSIKDVDFIEYHINGTYFDEKSQRWSQKFFPFPDVLYDRGGGTLKKQKVISNYIRKQLDFYKDMKKINANYYFDKWDVYEKLIKHEEMNQYLPYTMLYNSSEDLIEMFDRSSIIYIKTCYGSNGRGVARVIKASEANYQLSYFQDGIQEYELRSLNELIGQLQAIFQKEKIILQSAVNVIKFNDRLIDMRATIQRNGDGKVGVYSYPVRLGKERCPITSTKSGSTVYTLEDFFTRYYNYSLEQIEKLKTRINKMLLLSFNYIEEAYGSFGELGIDFAIDENFRIWFIECNAKPGKDAMYLSYDSETVKKAFKNPLEYAKYISGF